MKTSLKTRPVRESSTSFKDHIYDLDEWARRLEAELLKVRHKNTICSSKNEVIGHFNKGLESFIKEILG